MSERNGDRYTLLEIVQRQMLEVTQLHAAILARMQEERALYAEAMDRLTTVQEQQAEALLVVQAQQQALLDHLTTQLGQSETSLGVLRDILTTMQRLEQRYHREPRGKLPA